MCTLRQEPALLEQYDHTIKEQLENGIIETIDPLEPTYGKVHYLPNHAVVRKDKTTTKLHMVYDASARSTGPFLNDCLHKGPKFNQLILELLLRFRSYRIALIADIEKAFLMISVDDHDCDVLRFLVDDISKPNPKMRVFRFTRVVFGVSSSPFLLNATIKHHLERFLGTNEAVVRCLLNSTYSMISSWVLTLTEQHFSSTFGPRTYSVTGDSISGNLYPTPKNYNSKSTVQKG